MSRSQYAHDLQENEDCMKNMMCLLVTSLVLLITALVSAQERPTPVSFVELIANVDKFDNRLVTVQGFLRITHENKHGVRANLYLHREDANNFLNNDVLVIASEQMLKDVMLTGLFRVVKNPGGSGGGVIKDVRTCIPWSDPDRPISEQSKINDRPD
jgi:hypothetical protein